MINLLPPETKEAYLYARRNHSLSIWITGLLIGLLGIGLIGTYGSIRIHRDITKKTSLVSSLKNQLNKANLIGTESQVQTISSDFTLVVKVLSQEVLFSKLLSDMATTLPSGANLTGLTISNTSTGTGLDITAEVNNYTTATQLQVNLADPANGIFSKADLVSVTCGTNSTSSTNFNPNYPCTVTLRAQFAKNNQFLFINQGVVK